MTDPRELRDHAVAVALEAADLVRTRRAEQGAPAVVATKSSVIDVVTATDQESEVLIRERLADVRPDDGFLGEEGGASESRSGITWIVDPIDGTVNFLYGIPQYAVSIAASDRGVVVAGAVVNVATGQVYAAARGYGSTCDAVPLAVRPTPPMSERLIGTGFWYTRELRAAQAQAVARMLPEIRDIRRAGSCALDLCAVAAGTLDGYVEEGPAPWDHSAGGLIATEAGARVKVLPGSSGIDCVVCAPADGFTEFLELVRGARFLAVDDGE